MPRIFSPEEISEVLEMLLFQDLDIRSVTLSLNLQDCTSGIKNEILSCIEGKVGRYSRKLIEAVDNVAEKYGVKIVTKRIAVTPVSIIVEPLARKSFEEACAIAVDIARSLDRIATLNHIDYIGGYAAFVHKGFTQGDKIVIETLPKALAATQTVAAMVNVASTATGINVDAVIDVSRKIIEIAHSTPKGIGCARFTVMANAPEDNPFMPGAYHGLGEPEAVVNVAVSGPGAIEAAINRLGEKVDMRTLHDVVKRTAFKITRLGELIGREVAKELEIPFGIVDLSLAPSPKIGDSVARILEAMGLEYAGAPGSIAALYILTDAVKKGGTMATSSIGGLSGAFIPVSEDWGMSRAAEVGAINIDRLEAMMMVCNTGIDMVAIPGDVPAETIAAIILDVMAAAIMLDKTLGVRLIPVPGARAGDRVDFGGLLGSTIVMDVPRFSCKKFIERRGLIPPSVKRLDKG
ncbi:MAG: PFL family protein [Ignisphaera sp.]|nr:PFL family protein [Ignisphaera sp.]MCX8167514.1 PFL family protein [Ignisphaera sp.]MDW8084623.1 PFL family protein [Ignisphaera sp.]